MILTHRTSFPSAKMLRDALFQETGIRYLVTKYPHKIRRLHIRYGASSPVNCDDTEFNSPDFINTVAHKLRFSNAVKDKFHTPIFVRGREPRDDEFPIVIREYLASFGGKGIVMCPDRATFDENWNGSYWTQFVRTVQEFRVHVLGGEVGRLFRKIRIKVDGVRPEEGEFPIRTIRSGEYRFSLWRDNNSFPDLNTVVRDLHGEIGGHCYALDIGQKEDGDWYIYEANSAPGLNANTATEYAKYLVANGAV